MDNGLILFIIAVIAVLADAIRETLNDHYTTSIFYNPEGNFWKRDEGMTGNAGKWKFDGWHVMKAVHVGAVMAYMFLAGAKSYLDMTVGLKEALKSGEAYNAGGVFIWNLVFYVILYLTVYSIGHWFFYKKALVK